MLTNQFGFHNTSSTLGVVDDRSFDLPEDVALQQPFPSLYGTYTECLLLLKSPGDLNNIRMYNKLFTMF